MPLTRTEGDFSQVSNIVIVVTPEPPPPADDSILVGFLSGETWLVANDLQSGYQSGTVDLGLGYVLGYSKNNDSSILGAYGQALEGSSAGASRSTDFSANWAFEGAPIYSNASTRSTRVAFGNGVWILVGARTTGVGSAARSEDFGNDGFTWESITANLVPAVGTIGFAGIDFVLEQFYVYTNDGQIARSTDGNEWEVVATGGPSFTFNSNTANPYARFAADGTTIVCIAGGRIVASTDSGNTWEMAAYNDAFSSTDLIGGAGFNEPVEFGLAAGGGAFIAVGTVDDVPRIRRSTIGAEAVWTDIAVPAGPDTLYDVIYDSAGTRFLLLGKDTEFTPGLSGGEFFFDPGDAQGSGWSGSVAEGAANLFSTWSFVTGSQAEPCGNLQFGDIAGYFDIALIRTGELGGQWLLMIHVPDGELRDIPQSDYFEEIAIELSEGQIGPFSQEDANFQINFDSDQGVWELAWQWFDSAGFASENNLTAILTPSLTYTGGTSVYSFHVLQSVDAGVTWTDEFVQEYAGPDPDKGWLTLVATPEPSFNLLQEDGFLIQQEDESSILIDYGITVSLGGQTYPIIDWSWSVFGSLPPGVSVTGFQLFRMDAETFQDLTNFDPPTGIVGPLVYADLELLQEFDADTFGYADTDADPTLRQYAYFVRAIVSDPQYTENSVIPYSPRVL
jgi:hypothetical protein